MKNKIRNAFLGFLSISGILLVLFAIYGLITYEWNANSLGLSASISDSNYQETNKSNDNQNKTETKPENSTIKQEKTVMKEGDNPEIDDKIRSEIIRISDDFNFWSDTPINQKYYFVGGTHSASFTNTTGIDFPNIKFTAYLQDDNGNDLSSQTIYDSSLQSGKTVIFNIDTDENGNYKDVGNIKISWEYELQ